MSKAKKVAICFFGITRSVEFTISSIRQNIYEPANRYGDVKIFCHFFKQRYIDNPRSNERSELKLDEYNLLGADEVILDNPNECLENSDYSAIIGFGNAFDDEGQSTRNLFHQLWSLNKVTDSCLTWNPDIVVFVRPDLLYHDDLSNVFEIIAKSQDLEVLLPNWQHWGGLNDRFSIACGEDAIKAYGKRLGLALQFCSEHRSPLHSEKLLAYALASKNVKTFSNRATRVRSGGVRHNENFLHCSIVKFQERITKLFYISENNKILALIVWYLQRILYGNPYKDISEE